MEELWGQPVDAYCRDTGIPCSASGGTAMTRWSRPKSETPSARHTLARDAYAIRYGNIKNIVQRWTTISLTGSARQQQKSTAPVSLNT
jgi:hypothetical protein